jgi:hypothetical protein
MYTTKIKHLNKYSYHRSQVFYLEQAVSLFDPSNRLQFVIWIWKDYFLLLEKAKVLRPGERSTINIKVFFIFKRVSSRNPELFI